MLTVFVELRMAPPISDITPDSRIYSRKPFSGIKCRTVVTYRDDFRSSVVSSFLDVHLAVWEIG
eukprot:4826387-Pleurochrysis_carterae.AAC.14